MVDLETLKQAAQEALDEQGKPVVQIPLELWKAWLDKDVRPQNERIRAALAEWDVEAAELTEEWWDEFQAFLDENRLNLS